MPVFCSGKTHKGIQKRLRVTSTGKIVRRKSGKSHLLSGKSSKQLRRLNRKATVPDHIARQIKRQLIK